VADPTLSAIATNTADTIRQLHAVQAEIRRLPAGIKQALGAGRGGAGPAATRGPTAAGGGAAGGLDFAAALSGLARGATGAAAALAALGPAMLKAALPFVEAFNPALVERFHYALGNLMAAVGSFLTPIVEVATKIAEDLNATFTALAPILRPVMEQLAGAFALVAGQLLELVVPLVRQLVPFLEANVRTFLELALALVPLVEIVLRVGAMLAALTSMLVTLLRPGLELVRIFGEMLLAILPFEEIMGTLTTVMADLQTAITDFIAWIREQTGRGGGGVGGGAAGFIGGFFGGLGGALAARVGLAGLPGGAGGARPGGRPEGPRTVAAGEARFIDILEIGRQARLSAAGQANIAQQQLDVLEAIRRIQEGLPQATAAAIALVMRPGQVLAQLPF
jgi:hypothetical protein